MPRLTAELSPAELQKALDRAHVVSMGTIDALIAAGRGHEKAQETLALARAGGDALAQAYADACAAERVLRDERDRRLAWHGSTRRIIKKM